MARQRSVLCPSTYEVRPIVSCFAWTPLEPDCIGADIAKRPPRHRSARLLPPHSYSGWAGAQRRRFMIRCVVRAPSLLKPACLPSVGYRDWNVTSPLCAFPASIGTAGRNCVPRHNRLLSGAAQEPGSRGPIAKVVLCVLHATTSLARACLLASRSLSVLWPIYVWTRVEACLC